MKKKYIEDLYNQEKRTYTIPIAWEMYGHLQIQAESLEEAKKIALDSETALPDGQYITDSEKIDEEVIPDMNNDLLICGGCKREVHPDKIIDLGDKIEKWICPYCDEENEY